MERDGQGRPVVRGRRLPQVHILIGWHITRDAWGISIAGGLDPNALPGTRFYQWERGIYLWTGTQALRLRIALGIAVMSRALAQLTPKRYASTENKKG